MSTESTLNLTNAQCQGHACIVCGKSETHPAGAPEWIGYVDSVPVWACLGGCRFLAVINASPAGL